MRAARRSTSACGLPRHVALLEAPHLSRRIIAIGAKVLLLRTSLASRGGPMQT